MSDVSLCPRCHSSLSITASGSVCLTCLGSWALGEQTSAASSANAADLTVPGRLGDYELLEELGRGAMGVVYAARQAGLDRLVAVKVIAGGKLATVEAETRFVREAQTTARLKHANIVAVHAAGRIDGVPYYAMDHVDGLDLRQACTGGPLELREAARLVATAAHAIAYAHERGVVHRDLKPSNILIDDTGAPRIVDFGLAQWTSEPADLTRTGQILGSPAYMAPEQIAGTWSAAVDIYALGAILFFALTARAPFEGRTAPEVFGAITRDPAQPPSRERAEIPPALDAICLRCLEKNPGARYATAREVAEDLERWLAGEAVKTAYAPVAEARRVVAEIRELHWLEGFQRHGMLQAIGQLDSAVQGAPDDAVAHATLAHFHAGLIGMGYDHSPTRREIARQALARAEALDPQALPVLLARAYCLDALDGQQVAAARVLRGALEIHPDDGPTLLAAGRLAMAMARWNEAGDWLVRATRASPPSGFPRHIAAYRAFLLRDYASASIWIQDAVRLYPRTIVRRLLKIWFGWLADPDPERALAALRALSDEDRKVRIVMECECTFLIAARNFVEAHAVYARAPDDEKRIGSPQAAVELAELLRLQRLANADGQAETEKRLREKLDPTRVKAGRNAQESMSLAYSWAVLGEAEISLRYAAEARATCPWPANLIDGARLAGANEFLYVPGELALFAVLGLTDKFVDALRQWINVPGAVDVRYLAFDPWFDAVRTDPRSSRIMATAQMPIALSDPS